MDKKRLIIYACVSISILYFVIVFIVPFDHSSAFWISCFFSFIDIVIGIMVLLLYAGDDKGTGILFNIAIARNTVIYLIVQFVLSILIMAIRRVPLWMCIILYTVIVVGFVVLTIFANYAKDRTVNLESVRKDKTINLRNACVRINVLKDKASSPDVKNSLSKVYDILKYSDPIGNGQTVIIENDILSYISCLEQEVSNHHDNMVLELSEKIVQLVMQRNQLCKTDK